MNARRSARSTPRTEALLGGFLDHGMSREFEKEDSCAKLCLITKDFAEKKRFDLSLSSASGENFKIKSPCCLCLSVSRSPAPGIFQLS